MVGHRGELREVLLRLSRLADEVPAVMRKYALKEFDEARFIQDLSSWLTEFAAISGIGPARH